MNSTHSPAPKILITGATGGLALLVAEKLVKMGYLVVGIDPRRAESRLEREGLKFPGELHRMNYTHRKVEELFQLHHFDAIIHLGRVRVTSGVQTAVRYTLNVLGTRNILNLALKYHVPKVVVMSTFHVYGANPSNHLHITEDEPLRASQNFPELSDAIELDHYAQTFSLQYPEIQTTILRPVNIIGPRIKNTMSRLLKSGYCPRLLGYDPMIQFIHEEDMVKAIELSLNRKIRGVFNVAGEGMIPYSGAIERVGTRSVPIPHFLVYPAVSWLIPQDRFPRHLVDFFRYPVVIEGSAFEKEAQFKPDYSTIQALRSLRNQSAPSNGMPTPSTTTE